MRYYPSPPRHAAPRRTLIRVLYSQLPPHPPRYSCAAYVSSNNLDQQPSVIVLTVLNLRSDSAELSVEEIGGGALFERLAPSASSPDEVLPIGHVLRE